MPPGLCRLAQAPELSGAKPGSANRSPITADISCSRGESRGDQQQLWRTHGSPTRGRWTSALFYEHILHELTFTTFLVAEIHTISAELQR